MNEIPFNNRVKDRLLKRRAQLCDMLRGQGSLMLAEHSVGDFADGAAESEEAAVNSRITAAEHRELSEINHALGRLKAEQYGFCEECRGEIARERLKFLPYVTLCIDCQRKGELDS